LYLEGHHRDFGLRHIGPVERVEAVRADRASLHLLHRLLKQVFDQVAMVQDLFIALLDHDLECLVPVAAAEPMEVEVEELEFVFVLEFVHLSCVLRRDAHFPRRVVAKQIYYLAGPVGVQDALEVEAKGFLRHFSVASQVHFLGQSALFPEHRH